MCCVSRDILIFKGMNVHVVINLNKMEHPHRTLCHNLESKNGFGGPGRSIKKRVFLNYSKKKFLLLIFSVRTFSFHFPNNILNEEDRENSIEDSSRFIIFLSDVGVLTSDCPLSEKSKKNIG